MSRRFPRLFAPEAMAAAGETLAVGFFDGVHLGHRALLSGATRALTFRNHPRTLFAPEKAPPLIMSCAARLTALASCGVEVTALDFTAELAALEPAAFVAQYLSHVGCVRCGTNWRFGRGGRGDAAFLRTCGIAVEVLPYACYNGQPISSSRIRACLASGDVDAANAMLGAPYAVSGRRVAGKGLGRQLGYPTENVVFDDEATSSVRPILPCGVYAVSCGSARGLANYGHAPTLGADAWKTPVMEVHWLTDLPESASETRTLAINRFIRPERTFASLEDLKRQIAKDCANVKVES